MTEPAAPPERPWGRVDDDGTVYVRTSDGEVAVGSFQAGTHEEALAYYARKFDALAVEVELLERRVVLPEVPAEESMTTLKRVREMLATPTCVGDIEGLRGRLDKLVPVIEARRKRSAAGSGMTFAGPFETITPWEWGWFDHHARDGTRESPPT